MLKKFLSDKRNVTKHALFFFHELELITTLLLIHNLICNTRTEPQGLSLYIFHFHIRLVFIKAYIFFQQKA